MKTPLNPIPGLPDPEKPFGLTREETLRLFSPKTLGWRLTKIGQHLVDAFKALTGQVK